MVRPLLPLIDSEGIGDPPHAGHYQGALDPGGDVAEGLQVHASRVSKAPNRLKGVRPVSRLSAAIPHAASRRTTAPYPATVLSSANVVSSKAVEGFVKWCEWHGMQGVRGSNPLSSTLHHRTSEGAQVVPHGVSPPISSSLGHTWGTWVSAGLSCCSITAATRVCISVVMCR
jgi:hypothetical protein